MACEENERHLNKKGKIQVTLLGLWDTSASIIGGSMDIFYYAGRLWNLFFNEPVQPFFDVNIASHDGCAFSCIGNLTIQAHMSIASVEKTDLVIIPSIFNIDETLAREYSVIPWIHRMHQRGAKIAAICNGTFVLAETGLLDGKIATTHWGLAESFRHLYPKVILKPERLITETGNIFTAGGSNACFDISLYLVGKFCGQDVVRKLAKLFLHDPDRISQSPWMVFQSQQGHSDKGILMAQEFLETRYKEHFSLDTLARDCGMSRRTFERRFKSATGDSPLKYLQRIRIETAKRILETENKSLDEIAATVGYEDYGFFRKIFSQVAGISPKAYRKKWQVPPDFSISL